MKLILVIGTTEECYDYEATVNWSHERQLVVISSEFKQGQELVEVELSAIDIETINRLLTDNYKPKEHPKT